MWLVLIEKYVLGLMTCSETLAMNIILITVSTKLRTVAYDQLINLVGQSVHCTVTLEPLIRDT